MDGIFKAIAGIVVALILYLTVANQSKEIATVVSIVSCVIIALFAMNYLQPIITFFRRLQSTGKLDTELVTIMLQCAGIGVLSEITSLICADAGNTALGKTLQISAAIFVLWLSLPLFTKLMDLIEEILSFV